MFRRTVIGLCVLLSASLPALAAEQEITYLLPAPATLPAFGPWMVAQAKGYYQQEGLNVKFVSGRGGVDVAKQIGAGNAVVGGAIGDTPIIARAQGIPVKAVAVLGAGSLTLLAARSEQRIESPRELRGKTVTVSSYTDTTYYAFLGMLSKFGMSKSDMDIQAAGPAGVWQLLAAGKADAAATSPDLVLNAINAGVKIDIIPSSLYFKSMAQAILASDETIRTNPELVRKLVRATLKGMRDIMKDPVAAAVVYVNHVPAHKGREDYVRGAFEMFNKYTYANQQVLGQMNEANLAELQKFYVANGIVPKEAPLKDLYTNEFTGVK